MENINNTEIASEIIPILKKYEIDRIKSLLMFILITIAIIVFNILQRDTFGYNQNMFHRPFIFLFTLILLVMTVVVPIWLAYFFINHSFTNKIKKECMPKILKNFKNIKWLKQEPIITSDEIQDSELFGVFNTRINDDGFSGKYKDTKFKVQEINLINQTGTGKNKMIWTVFDGVIIIVDSNKVIKNKTIVTTKNDINTRNSNPLLWISILLVIFGTYLIYGKTIAIIAAVFIIGLVILYSMHEKKTKEQLSKITLEDPEFNKRYNMYSSDQIEGRYLVTTAFMERFKNIHTAFGSNKAKCAFLNDKIMFSISTTKNLFELGNIFTPLGNKRQINIFLEELASIYAIIDYFKLTEELGL